MDYVDTSAFLKLIAAERESLALRRALHSSSGLVSSALLGVESLRAAYRIGSEASARTRIALRDVTLVPIDDTTISLAAEIEPSGLRSLDAIHLATALSLGEDLNRIYCYDSRSADAAAELGLRVAAPA